MDLMIQQPKVTTLKAHWCVNGDQKVSHTCILRVLLLQQQYLVLKRDSYLNDSTLDVNFVNLKRILGMIPVYVFTTKLC